MSDHFIRQIDKIKQMVLSLGSAVEHSLDLAIRAVEQRDTRLAHSVIDDDSKIDLMEVDIEEECLHVLALYQPVASDLRFLVAVLTISKDLERIGDLTSNLAEQALFLAEETPIQIDSAPIDLAEESVRVRAMLNNSLDALVTRDAALARAVLADDDAVDALHRQAYQNVKEAIAAKPSVAGYMIDLLNVSRRLERIADHAVNIAEDVIYLVEGRIVRHEQSQKLPPQRLK